MGSILGSPYLGKLLIGVFGGYIGICRDVERLGMQGFRFQGLGLTVGYGAYGVYGLGFQCSIQGTGVKFRGLKPKTRLGLWALNPKP